MLGLGKRSYNDPTKNFFLYRFTKGDTQMMGNVDENLKFSLQAYVESITEKSKGNNMYVCPLCRSGTGKHGTGAFSIKDGTSWKCFSCGEQGDILDLIGKYENIEDFKDRLKRARELFSNVAATAAEHSSSTAAKTRNNDEIERNENSTGENYMPYFIQANKDLEKTSYHRGISLETLNRFKVGYVERWKHPKAPPKAPFTPRLIIPTSKESYLARDTRNSESIPEEQKQYDKSKVGKTHIFNLNALTENTDPTFKPIFIVEGEIDALSIIDVGGKAIGLGTISKIGEFLKVLEKTKPAAPLVLALDNDAAGKSACDKLAKGLKELDIPFYRKNIAGKYKDPNEFLMNDRATFAEEIAKADNIENLENDEKAEYMKSSAGYCLQDFIDGIADSANTPAIPTGFKRLDQTLDGGLFEGLYIVGAISSLGKTTFVTQMADQMAANGKDVLIFSLEMARNEIIAKSISKNTALLAMKKGLDIAQKAKSARYITQKSKYKYYDQEEKDLIEEAINQYSTYAENIYINEGIGDIGVTEVRETIDKHKRITGKKPIVIIDYIQILAPYNDRATDKQNVDKAVLELKRISRDFKIPVIGISSFNRANYSSSVSMEAFKESGAIEYSSDVLIGLQLQGAGAKDFDATRAKAKDPRSIELLILKNRNGIVGRRISYNYYPRFNYFYEDEEVIGFDAALRG